MISEILISSTYSSICYCSFQFFINVDKIYHRFGAPCFPRELVCSLMSEEIVCNLKFITEAEVN